MLNIFIKKYLYNLAQLCRIIKTVESLILIVDKFKPQRGKFEINFRNKFFCICFYLKQIQLD